MQKLTKERIEKLANDIKKFLEKYGLDGDVSIYYNNKVERSRSTGWETTENVDPHNYFEYAAYNHILSMSFEGALYHDLNYNFRYEDRFQKIFDKYGLYYEMGNAWNLTCYLADDNMEVEYTVYKEPKEPIYMYRVSDSYHPILNMIMEKWYHWSAVVGDKGSCVLGAGFKFEWKGDEYFMTAQSPYQGSISWETSKDDIKELLEGIGATNIVYEWGQMD